MKMRWILVLGAAAGLLVAVVGCGSSGRTAARVPDVTQQPLDAAQDALDAEGLRYDTVGGGLFGIVVRSHWTVCSQEPRAGTVAEQVTLYVARDCGYSTRVVPDVVWLSLPEADEELEHHGFDSDEESLSGDPVIVESRWTVCDQWPRAGDLAGERTVTLYVAHDCYEED